MQQRKLRLKRWPRKPRPSEVRGLVPDSLHSTPFYRYVGAVAEDQTLRQEAQIVQSWFTLEDFSPRIA